MERLHINVGVFNRALEQAPKVFKPVRMHLTVDVLLSMVNDSVVVIGVQSFVRGQRVGEDFGAFQDVFPAQFNRAGRRELSQAAKAAWDGSRMNGVMFLAGTEKRCSCHCGVRKRSRRESSVS